MEIDSTKLNDSGKDIMLLSKELNEEFEALFTELANLEKSSTWIGGSASEFIRKSQIEKAEYMKFKNSIWKYGNLLSEASSTYEGTINSLKR